LRAARQKSDDHCEHVGLQTSFWGGESDALNSAISESITCRS
jgi:hypothetical protein